MKYKDFTFNISEYGQGEVIEGTNSVINSIKIILLSRPGNFPFNPRLGMDIEKYQFELLDNDKIHEIKTELLEQLSEFNPYTDSVIINMQKVEVTGDNGDIITGLGITVSSISNDDEVYNILVWKNLDTISIYNEVM